MENGRFCLYLFIVMFFLSGCSAFSVVSDYDQKYDFTSFQHYRWPAESEGIRKGDVLVENPLVYKRVQSAVNEQLRVKGFRLTGSGDADFIVYAHAGVKKQKTYHNSFGVGVPYGPYRWYRPWWGPYGGYTFVSYYDEGSLVIDIIDARTKELVWRGVATRIVRDYRNAEDMQRDINEAVAKILESFPPGASPETK
jgi:hypothetical protein